MKKNSNTTNDQQLSYFGKLQRLAVKMIQHRFAIAILGALLGLVALFFPFVTLYENRAVPVGDTFNLWSLYNYAASMPPKQISIPHSFLAWPWGNYAICGWLSVLLAAFFPAGRFNGWLLAIAVAATGTVLIAAFSIGAAPLVETQYARVSLSSGAWLGFLAIYITMFAVFNARPISLLIPLICFLFAICLSSFQHWGVYREYLAVNQLFHAELMQHIFLVFAALPYVVLFGVFFGWLATTTHRFSGAILAISGFMQTIPSITLFGLSLPILAWYGQNISLIQSIYALLSLSILLASIWYLIESVDNHKINRVLYLLFTLLSMLSLIIYLPILVNLSYQIMSNPIDWIGQISWHVSWNTLGIRGLGATPALIALIAYGVFPVIINMHTGLKSVPQALTDAAMGIGMSPKQVFWRVKFPFLLPFLIDGIRLAMLMLISLTTISVLVNAGGLGVFLTRGTEQSVQDLILLGCLFTVLFALTVDLSLRLLVWLITPKGLRQE